MTRAVLIGLLLAACGDDGGMGAGDAGLDAQAQIALTVDGPVTVATTRSLKVTITANGHTRSNSFPVAGLPATVEMPQPIQLSTWAIVVDGYDMNGGQVGRGTASVPAGTSDTMVTLQPTP